MKFGKLLQKTTEGMGPEMEDLFVRYKELKKHLKAMKQHQALPEVRHVEAGQHEGDAEQQQDASSSGNQEQAQGASLSEEETAFVTTLNEDLMRFNAFFMDREEESIIKLQALSDRIAAAAGAAELVELKAELVDFHGEMVLLLHWSLLNYAAVVKILKKHDKRSGLLLRAPYLTNVLQQPFYSTSIMSRLVKRAEDHINGLVVRQQEAEGSAVGARGGGGGGEGAAPGAAEVEAAEAAAAEAAAEAAAGAGEDESGGEGLPVDTAVFARTRQALQTWQQLGANASTPSTVLPAGAPELVRQLRVRERWARLVGVPPGEQPAEQPAAADAAPATAPWSPAAAAVDAPCQSAAQQAAETDTQRQWRQQQEEEEDDDNGEQRRRRHPSNEPQDEADTAAAKRQRC